MEALTKSAIFIRKISCWLVPSSPSRLLSWLLFSVQSRKLFWDERVGIALDCRDERPCRLL